MCLELTFVKYQLYLEIMVFILNFFIFCYVCMCVCVYFAIVYVIEKYLVGFFIMYNYIQHNLYFILYNSESFGRYIEVCNHYSQENTSFPKLILCPFTVKYFLNLQPLATSGLFSGFMNFSYKRKHIVCTFWL